MSQSALHLKLSLLHQTRRISPYFRQLESSVEQSQGME